MANNTTTSETMLVLSESEVADMLRISVNTLRALRRKAGENYRATTTETLRRDPLKPLMALAAFPEAKQ